MSSRIAHWRLRLALLTIATGLVFIGLSLPALKPHGQDVRALSLPTAERSSPTLRPSATPTPRSGRRAPTPTAELGPTKSPGMNGVRTQVASPSPTALPTPDGVSRQARVPILMYHYLSAPPANADRYRRDLSVSPPLFAQHLAYLKAQDYQTISLYDLLDHLARGRPLPAKPIILTFDDGYRDNYQNAFPLLKRYGFKATFFVVAEMMGFTGDPSYMTWSQLRAMAKAGMSIECHGRTHVDLTQVDYDHLVWQVLGCKEMIEQELGRRPRFVAYPTGGYNDQVIALFASDNYWGGVTTVQDTLQESDKPFELKRLRVRGVTSVQELAELLAWEPGG